MSDKTIDEDIRKKLKSGKHGAFSYGANVAKSFLHMGKYMVKSEMPTLFSYGDVNKDLVDEIYQTVKNPRQALGSRYNNIVNSGEFAEIKKIAAYALDDIKSGRFYDETRDRTNIGLETEDLLSDFGGVDFDDYGSDEFSAEDVSLDKKFDVSLAQKQEENANNRTGSTISAIGSATDVIVENINANHDLDIKTRMKQHDQTVTGLNNIAMGNAANYELTSSAFSELLNLTRDANVEILEKMDGIKSVLEEIRDTIKPQEMTKSGNLNSTIEMPFKNGALDIKKYLNVVKQNVNNKYDIDSTISMLTQGMDVKDLLELYKSNPIGGLISTAIRSMAPKGFFKNINEFDKTLKKFGPSALLKIGNLKNKDDGDSILSLLGIKAQPYNNIKTEYNMGKVPFTGKTDKAITEVIPLLLSTINSSITGAPLKVYDYGAGKFVDAKTQLGYTERQLGNYSSLVTAKSKMTDSLKYVDSNILDTYEKRQNFERDISKFFDKMVQQQSFMDMYQIDKESSKAKIRDTATDIFGYSSNSNQKLNILMGLLRSLDRKDLIGLPGEILNIGNDQEAKSNRIIDDLRNRGLMSLYSDVDDGLNEYKNKVSSNIYATDDELDNRVKNSKERKNDIKSAIVDIRELLIRGIVTYSYGLGNVSENQKVSDYVKNIVSDEQYDTLRKINKLKEEDEEEAKRIKARLSDSARIADNSIGLSDAPASLIAEKVREARLNDENKNKTAIESSSFMSDIFGSSANKNFNDFKNVLQTPFQGILNVLDYSENIMYKFLYGEGYANTLRDKNDRSSLFSTLSTFFTGLFTKSENTVRDLVSNKIVNPLSNALFSNEHGIITNYVKDRVNPLISKGLNKVSSYVLGNKINTPKLDEFGMPLYETDSNGNIVYTTNEKGENVPMQVYDTSREGGLFSGLLNRGKTYKDAIKDKSKIYKDKSKSYATSFIGELNGYFFGTKSTSNTEEKESRHKGIFSSIGAELKSDFNKFKTWLFGEDVDGEKSDSRKIYDDIKGEISKAVPDMAIQGVIGAGTVTGIGMLTGLFLPGGPILGAIIGAGSGLVTGSEKLREFIFGEDGIDEQVVEGFKKYAPKIGIGATIGGALGNFGLLPFGLGSLSGAAIGSLSGLISASDDLKEILFGSKDDDTSGLFSKNNRESFFKKVLPTSLIAGGGAALLSSALASGVGIFPALTFLPHGPLVGMFAGLTAAFNADSIRDAFFGDGEVKDENGRPTGKYDSDKRGIFVKVFDTTRDDLFKPLLSGINNMGKGISNWFQESIVKEMKEAMQPMKDEISKAKNEIGKAFRNIGSAIVNGINNAFNHILEKPLDQFLKDNIFDPLKKHTSTIMKALGKVVGGLISAPFKLINIMFNPDRESSSDKDYDIRKKMRDEKYEKRRAEQRLKAEERRKKRAYDKLSPEEKADVRGEKFITKMNDLKTVLVDIKNAILGVKVSDNDNIKNIINNSEDTSTNKEIEKKDRNLRNKINAEARAKSRDEKRLKKADDKKRREEARIKYMEEIDAKREEKSKDKNSKNSPNRNIANIAYYTKKTSDFLENNISGIGYDIRYMRNMLIKQNGVLDGDMLPENGNRNGKIPKKYSKFARVFSWLGDKKNALGDWTYDKLDKARGLVGYILNPFKILAAGAKGFISKAGEFLGGVKTFLGGLLDSIGHTLKTSFDTLVTVVGDSVKTVANVIAGSAKGFGEAIGSVVKELGGALGGLIGVVGGLTSGLSEFAKEIFPELGRGLAKMIVGGAKLAKKAVVGGGKLVASGVTGLFNLRNKKNIIKEKTKIRDLGEVYVNGGKLDNIINMDSPIKTGIYGVSMNTELKQVAMAGSIAISKSPKYALPVYIAGTYSDQPSIIKDKKKKYSKYNRVISSNTKSLSDKYDEIMNSAEDSSDIDVIRSVHELNDIDNSGGSGGSGGSGKNKKDDDKGLLTTILSALGLGGVVSKIGAVVKGAATTGMALLPLILGTKLAIDNGNGGQVLENVGRAGIGITASSMRNGILAKSMSNGVLKNIVGRALTNEGTIGKIAGTMFASSGENVALKSSKEILKNTTGKIGANLISKGFLTRGTDGLLQIAAGAATEGSISSRVISLLNTSIRKFFGLRIVKEKLGESVAAKAISPMLKLMKDKLSDSIIGQVGKKLIKYLGGPGVIAITAAADFTSGMLQAANIFNIRSSDLDLKMRVTAGVAKAISGLTFGLISEDAIAEVIYPIVASKEEEKDLYESQQYLAQQASVYGMTSEEFNEGIQNRTFFRKITDWFKDTFTDNKSDYYKYKNGTLGSENSEGNGNGKGIADHFIQTDSKWNNGEARKYKIDKTGCGPTVAAMMVNGLGNSDPVEASKMSIAFGDRDYDGGTKPDFFEKYGAYHGKSMRQGPVDANAIKSTLSNGGKVALMGRDNGSLFGKNMHYVMADGMDKSGNVIIKDPMKPGNRKKNIREIVSNSKTAVYGKGIGDAISGIFNAFSSGIDKMISARFGLPITTDSSTSGSSSSGSTSGSSIINSANINTGSYQKNQILKKLFEITVTNEGGVDGYTKITKDTNDSVSIGIIQWNNHRIVPIMTALYQKLPLSTSAKHWATEIDWTNAKYSKLDITSLQEFLTSNYTQLKLIEDSIATQELETTLLDRIYKDGRLTDAKAIILLADIANTGPALIPGQLNSFFNSGGKNDFDSMYQFLINKSYWATSTNANGYRNRISKTYNTLKSWSAPSASSNIGNIEEWFTKNMSNSKISQHFGENPNNGYNGSKGHSGIDIAAPAGTKIPTPTNGSVVTNRYSSSYGNMVEVQDSNSYKHIFAHMEAKSPVPVGTKVSIGDIVGSVGTTGSSTGNHLHYGITNGPTKIDPVAFYGNNGMGRGNIDARGFNNSNIDLKFLKDLNISMNGKGSAYNNDAVNLAVSSNKKISSIKKNIAIDKNIDNISKKLDNISDSNGKGSGDNNAFISVMTEMLSVLKNIEKNTANTIPTNNINKTNIVNNDNSLPVSKAKKFPSSGTQAIDLLTAK